MQSLTIVGLVLMCWNISDILSMPVADSQHEYLRCPYGYYRIQNGGCMLWDTCPKGRGMNKEWQSDQPYESYGDLPVCVDCIDGVNYSEHDSPNMCEPCGEPCTRGLNLNETKSCTRNHDRRCFCKRGMFEGSHGRCTQYCCTCDGGTHVNQKCKDDGMPTNMRCLPTNEDGTCNESTVTTTITTSDKTLPPVAPNVTTTERTTTIIMHHYTVVKKMMTDWIIVGIIVGTFVFLIFVVVAAWYIRRKYLKSNRQSDSSDDQLPLTGESVSARRIPYEGVPSAESSPATTLNRAVMEETQNSHSNRIYDRIDRIGLRLKDLSYCQRTEIGKILDHKEVGNWQVIGMEFAGENADFIDEIRRCHQCFYGGGDQMLLVFQRLSTKKPDFSVTNFVEIAHTLRRSDVVDYIIGNGLLDQKLNEVAYSHQRKIAVMLDKRVDVDKGHYWLSFASELGFSCDEINDIKMKLQEPQKYSPTYEMIQMLVTRLPDIQVEEFIDAAVKHGVSKIKQYLDGVIADWKTESVVI